MPKVVGFPSLLYGIARAHPSLSIGMDLTFNDFTLVCSITAPRESSCLYTLELLNNISGYADSSHAYSSMII